MKRVYSIQSLCLGCGLCKVACTTAHSKTGDIIKAYKFEEPKPLSSIRVEGDKVSSIAVQCRHCDNPICVSACITGAMTKDLTTGVVSVNSDRCIGCLTCVVACPFGCVLPNVNVDVADSHCGADADTNAVAGKAISKCDLCAMRANGKNGTPACVEACPNRALIFADDTPNKFLEDLAANESNSHDCEVK